MAVLEISDLMSLMEEFPAFPPPGSSLLESPSSPLSTTTEDLSVFSVAEFEGSYMDLPPPDEGADGAALGAAARRNPRKRPVQDVSPAAPSEEEARKAQRMARNRRAAATSRQRKKDQLGSLQSQVESLQDENAELRRRLEDAGLMSDELESQLGRRPYGLQPAALCWTQSPQLDLPLHQLALLLSLALLRVHLLQTLTCMAATTTFFRSALSLTTEVCPRAPPRRDVC